MTPCRGPYSVFLLMIILPEYELFVQNKKFESLNRAKQRAVNVIKLYYDDGSPLYKRYAERILNCSNDLTLIVHDDIASETYGRTTFKDARWCCVRNCPMCQLARSSKLKAKFFKSFNDKTCAGLEFLFLTLTVRNCSTKDLRSTVTMMGKAWQRFTQRKGFPGQGFIRSFEVTMQRDRLPKDGKSKASSGPSTRSCDGSLMAHPHLHIVLCLKPGYFESGFKDKDWWIDQWQSCLKADYRPSVAIKKIDYDDDMVRSLLETLKYSTKPADTDVLNTVAGEWLYDITRELHGVRALSVGGNIAAFCKQEDLNSIDDTCDTDDKVEQSGRHFEIKWNDKRERFDVVSGHIIYTGDMLVNSEFIKNTVTYRYCK